MAKQNPGMNNSEITSILGRLWREMTAEDKRSYKQTAQQLKNLQQTRKRTPKLESKYLHSFRLVSPDRDHVQKPTQKSVPTQSVKPSRRIELPAPCTSPRIPQEGILSQLGLSKNIEIPKKLECALSRLTNK